MCYVSTLLVLALRGGKGLQESIARGRRSRSIVRTARYGCITTYKKQAAAMHPPQEVLPKDAVFLDPLPGTFDNRTSSAYSDDCLIVPHLDDNKPEEAVA